MKQIDARERKTAFANLFNLYVYELSFYDPWLGSQINEDGQYLPPGGLERFLDGEHFQTSLIMEEEKPVGFVTFSENTAQDGAVVYSLDEIFVLKAFRERGMATDILREYLQLHRGHFTTHVLKNNIPAREFLTRFFEKEGMRYEIRERDEVAINYEAYRSQKAKE